MKRVYILIALIISFSAFNVFAKQAWKGPAGTACEFDLGGKHYVGQQYATGTQSGSLNAGQGWGCRSGKVVQEAQVNLLQKVGK